ncbi:MAG: hypothetical protein ACE5MB_06575, partial [Anaerolineae bacterium]
MKRLIPVVVILGLSLVLLSAGLAWAGLTLTGPNVRASLNSSTVLIIPREDSVGWVVSNEATGNHFGDDDMYTGFFIGRLYHGAMQFDLSAIPPGSTIHSASVELTGQTREFMGSGGQWNLQLLEASVDADWPSHTYADIHEATVAYTIPPTLYNADLGEGVVNTFSFTPDQLPALGERVATTGRASFRLDGPSAGIMNVFSWDSGYGVGGLGRPPMLRINYTSGTPRPTATPIPSPTATPTLVPTPTPSPPPTSTPTLVPSPTATLPGPSPTPPPTPQLPGQLIGPNFPISTAEGWQGPPAMAYNSLADEYLVVWEDRRAGNPDIYGQRVSGSGALIGDNFPICTEGSWQMTPAVAYSSLADEYLVVWSDWRTSGPDIYGQRISSSGALLGDAFPISRAANEQRSPAVAYNNLADEYLVVWQDHRSFSAADFEIYQAPSEVYGQRVSSSGALLGGDFVLSAAPGWLGTPVIAYGRSANGYLVAWASGEGIMGQRVASNGELQGDNFAIAVAAQGSQWSPSLAYNGTDDEYLAVWKDYRNNQNNVSNADIYGQRVSSEGALLGSEFLITPAGDQGHPAVAYNALANEYLVVWTEGRNAGTAGLDIYGQRVSRDGSLIDSDFAISTAGADQRIPAVAYNGAANQYLVTWQDFRNEALSGRDLYGQRVGLPQIGPTPTPIRTPTPGPTATATSIPTPTLTPLPPTPTWTPVPPTATPLPSATPTTTVSPTATATGLPPTPTATPASPTATFTSLPSTATATSTPTFTSTPVSPTATFTPLPPTATATGAPPPPPPHPHPAPHPPPPTQP